MNGPLRYVLVGVGGWGEHWRSEVLPRLDALGLARAAGAVDINPELLPLAKESLRLDDAHLFTGVDRCKRRSRSAAGVMAVEK